MDLGELLSGLREGLEEQSMAKVTEVKAMVEQGEAKNVYVCVLVEFAFSLTIC